MDHADIARAQRCAQAYRDMGLSPLPSRRDRKAPTIEFDRYKSEPLEPWRFDRWGTTNIQLMTGVTAYGPVKIAVVDCDGKQAISKWSYICQRNSFDLSSTWSVNSGSGTGRHFYFRLPENVTSCPSRMIWGVWDTYGKDGRGSWQKHKEIRLLADDNLAIAPPSIHVETRKRYSYLQPKPLAADIQLAPEWLTAMPAAAKPSEPTLMLWQSSTSSQFLSTRQILDRIQDKLGLAQSWGLRVTGRGKESGWVSCRAATREDNNPSATFNLKTGYYDDFAAGESCSLFDLGVLLGQFSDWRDCARWCEEQFK